MNVYLIVGTERGSTSVECFPSKDEAKAAAEGHGPEIACWVAGSAADLAALPGPLLVRLFNAIAPDGVDQVKRFKTREAGADRLFALLDKEAQSLEVHGGKPQAQDTASSSSASQTSAAPTNAEKEGDMPKKTKAKKKSTKAPKAARVSKARDYKAKVVSKGSEKVMAAALELIKRPRGATAQEIAEKLELTVGSAKNQVWYLRRAGHKIVVDKASERRPYVVA